MGCMHGKQQIVPEARFCPTEYIACIVEPVASELQWNIEHRSVGVDCRISRSVESLGRADCEASTVGFCTQCT